MALGIDYRKYLWFKILTPHVIPVMSGDPVIGRRFKDVERPSQNNARFCLEFVIESALALADFDYTLYSWHRRIETIVRFLVAQPEKIARCR